MKKSIGLVLTVVLLFLCACGVTGTLNGTYMSESGEYKVEFKNNGTCTWYQDGVFFNGEYQKTDLGWQLNINGSGSYTNTVFEAKQAGRDLIINGGFVYGELFVKQ